MVAQLASGVLKSPATGEAKGLPGTGLQLFIPLVHDVYGDIVLYTPSTGNSV